MGKSGVPGRPKQQHRIKVLHPQSRKAVKLSGKVMRKQRVDREHTQTALKQGLLLDKLQWFQDNRDESKDSYTKTDIVELAKKYLQRFEGELEQIEIIHGMKSRRNRQHAAREDVIRMTMKREEGAFNTSGIEMPDINDTNNLERFLKWDGTAKHAHLIKMRKVKLSMASASKKNKHQSTGDDNTNNDEDDMKEAEEDTKEEAEEEEEETIGEGDAGEEPKEQGLEEDSEEDERTDSMDVDVNTDP